MENENKESKSNGMELLENVIKSNMENIEQNVKLVFAIEDHTNLLNEVQMSLQDRHSIYEDAVRFSELEKTKRAEFIAITDSEAMQSGLDVSKTEGIIPAIETAHAFSVLDKKQFQPNDIVVINLSGRGDKDLNTYIDYFKFSE